MKAKIFLVGWSIFYVAGFALGNGAALADTKVLSGKHTIIYDIVNPLGVEFLPNYANNSYSQKVLQQDFSGMDGFELLGWHDVASVIVHDLNLVRAALRPAETDPPLIVEANAVLTSTVPTESLQPVPWRDSEILEPSRRIELSQLPKRNTLEVWTELPDGLAGEQPLGIPVAEAPNHRP